MGLRLTPGSGNQIVQPQGTEYPLMGYLSSLLETALYPANQGQIRSPDEENQTIDIYTGDLQLTEFSPPDTKIQKVRAGAKSAVESYFSLSFTPPYPAYSMF